MAHEKPTNRLLAGLRALIIVLLYAFAPIRSSGFDDNIGQRIARVESANRRGGQGLDALTLEQVMHQLHVPGMSIAVINNFRIEWTRAYGIADVQSGRPVQPHTRFQALPSAKL
jgi:CubicO group peptidase (beta-lactamase class C family)